MNWDRQFWFHFLPRSFLNEIYTSKKEAAVASCIYASGILGINFVMLWSYIKYFTGFDLYRSLGVADRGGWLLTFILMALVLFFNYRYLFDNDNYLSIIEEYANETNSYPAKDFKGFIKRMYVMLILVVLTFLNLFIVSEVLN